MWIFKVLFFKVFCVYIFERIILIILFKGNIKIEMRVVMDVKFIEFLDINIYYYVVGSDRSRGFLVSSLDC